MLKYEYNVQCTRVFEIIIVKYLILNKISTNFKFKSVSILLLKIVKCLVITTLCNASAIWRFLHTYSGKSNMSSWSWISSSSSSTFQCLIYKLNKLILKRKKITCNRNS